VKKILQFNFETGDVPYKYYQIYIVVENADGVIYEAINEIITEYFYVDEDFGDAEYEDIVEDIMKISGLAYSFMQGGVPESMNIYSYWIA